MKVQLALSYISGTQTGHTLWQSSFSLAVGKHHMHVEPAAGLVYLLHTSLIPFQDKIRRKKPHYLLNLFPWKAQNETGVNCNNLSSK